MVEFEGSCSLKAASHSAEECRQKGMALIRAGQQEEGESLLREACRLAPQVALNHLTLGAALLNENKLAESHAYLRFALNCEPHARMAHALIASTSLGLGANALAEYHAQQGLFGHEAAPVETDELARTIFHTAQARRGAQTSSPSFEVLASDSVGRANLKALQDMENGEYEAALFDLVSLIDEDFDNKAPRSTFLMAFQRFKAEAEAARYDEFIDALNLSPLPKSPAADRSQMPPPGTIDIIIPVFNALDDLKTCLKSIRKWSSDTLGRIILVDDASDPETREWLELQASNSRDVFLIRNAQNIGFTRSVMTGVRASNAPFALMLNSDTVVTAGWLDGLWRAMNRQTTTALAGPLTNNSYYQTIQPEDAKPDHLAVNPDLVAALVMVKSRNLTPAVPLLSGFCLLVRREAFDQVSGLDEEGFPWGYWEVQDLCLRLKDIGWGAVIADDVYVHHSGSKSIAGERKKRLISDGLKLIHDRYSALRFHVAEALCATEPVVLMNHLAWKSHESESASVKQQAAEYSLPNVLISRPRIAKSLSKNSADTEICLFVMHAPFGTAPEYTLEFIGRLQETGITVIVCMTTETLTMPVDPAITKIADGLVIRQNCGFDFAAWAEMLRIFPDTWQAQRLYFVNDSIIGPFRPLNDIISAIRTENAGFFALSESTFGGYHAQSFFFGWNRANLQSRFLSTFWQDVKVETTKDQVIHKYERKISTLSPQMPDPTQQILYGMRRIFNSDPSEIFCVSPTHHAWRRLMAEGFPFLKTDLLREAFSYTDTNGWEDICRRYGGNVEIIKRHLEQSRLNRVLNKALWRQT